MHPRSIELGAVYNVPIYVASSFVDAPGTLIHQASDERQMEDRIKVTGIAYQANVAKVTVCGVADKPGRRGGVVRAVVRRRDQRGYHRPEYQRRPHYHRYQLYGHHR